MAQDSSSELHKGLTQRHLTMIAIGGVIGAGLFVGSGVVINTVGPGAFLTYAVTGVLIVMVMRMLGEMATANPATGSFAAYARQALGDWAGFSVAWLYWYFWVIVVGFEAVAGAGILQKWLPDVPLWLMSLVLLLLMTATNLYSVKSYGEFEYWFASIKVAAIFVFLLLGTLYVLGLWPGKGMDFSNLYAHGGFFPNGSRPSSRASSWSSSRWSAPRSRPSPRRSPPSPSAPSPARSTPWWSASASSSSARSSCSPASCRGTPRSWAPTPMSARSSRWASAGPPM